MGSADADKMRPMSTPHDAQDRSESQAGLTLVLASRSPRRAQLLADAGFAVVQRDPRFQDPPHPEAVEGEAVSDLATRVAAAGARSVDVDDDLLTRGRAGRIVIVAADTIVVDVEGRLLGQPVDREDARRVIRSLTDAAHDVVTGVALLDVRSGAIQTFADTAVVHLGRVDDASLEAYLDTGLWRGKAGGYNLFERQPHWPLRVEGDQTTVVGLPMRRLVERLGAGRR